MDLSLIDTIRLDLSIFLFEGSAGPNSIDRLIKACNPIQQYLNRAATPPREREREKNGID